MISTQNLIDIGVKPKTAAIYEPFLVETLTKYSINTYLRICHFLTQSLHESAMLERLRENLNYSTEGLLKTFPTHFDMVSAPKYAHIPVKIANRAYAGKYGNGNEVSGDGWKFRGRGLIQITFKDNYSRLANDTGIDCVAHPELLLEPKNAAISAGWFWNTRHLNLKADADDLIGIRKVVNGGLTGLGDCEKLLTKAKEILKISNV